MQFLVDLWMPIVVAAVAVFLVSSVIHMVAPIHKGDYGELAGEASVLAAIRDAGVTRGTYMFPYCSTMQAMGTPEMLAKYEQGPVGYTKVVPSGTPAIGGKLLHWFLLSLVVGVFTGYVAHHSLASGASFGAVLRISGAVAIAGYALGDVQNAIWKGVPWRIAIKFVGDGVAYGVTTALVFAWLWPAAI